MTSTLDMQTRIQDATINAQAAFFAEIAKAFPEIKTCDDFSADPTLSFSEASKVATVMLKFNEACLAATTTLVDSNYRAAITLKTFKVTAHRYNGETDATDDRVFWVQASLYGEILLAVEGTGADFFDTIDGDSDIDFILPAQMNELRAALLKFAPTETTTDTREIANDPKLFLEELGYTIVKSASFFGFWMWVAPTANCDSSFSSAKEALEGAWTDVVAQTMGINNLSSDQWDAMSFEHQKAKIIESLGD